MQTGTYEARLSANLQDALLEGSRHFEGESAVFASLARITRRLGDLGLAYAVGGGMAMFAHGFRRFTEDVDILVSQDGLGQLHAALIGDGYSSFEDGKQLRDGENRVRIGFLVTGQFPGDGKPKPVVFPDPADVSTIIDGIRYLRLPTLIDLKLASGMTAPGRLKDLGDVQELIRTLGLAESFADQLDPYTREKYLELWHGVQSSPNPFE